MTTPVTLRSVRLELAAAIKQAGYQSYEAPLATVTPPGVVITPSSPYLEAVTIGSGGLLWNIGFDLIVAVAFLDNRAALAQLEEIVVKVAQSLPNGVSFGEVSQPALEDVGPTQLLTARMPVIVRAQLTPTT
jgi:hypothetical protein